MSNYVVDNILGNIGYSIYQKRSKLVDKINLLLAKLTKNVRFSTAKNMEDKAISMSKKKRFFKH